MACHAAESAAAPDLLRRAAAVAPVPFDPSERPVVGLRSREWTAVSATEVEAVAEMARCLREIKEGRAPG